ncbi:acetylcholinesterase-1 [Caerostris extrusa]|uniref:Acetylcholinesterase-1 n=1 Tax=Caerostris extrusa TaxID=172846 RepID=A0AAV4MW76_CAEEX|nr:acetylcholinesterase-1 [Caerostris extrusa]
MKECSEECKISVNEFMPGDPDTFGFFGEKDVQINKTAAASIIQKYFSDFPDTKAVIQHYLPDYIPEDEYDLVRYQAYTSLGDMTLVCPDVYYAEKCSEKGSDVFFYFWTHRSSTTPWAPWMGVVHFSELDFVFGLPLLSPKLSRTGTKNQPTDD